MKLEEMNRRLNEALDTDLFEESESEFNEFQAEVDSFERELEEISDFRQDHLQLSELKKIGAIQKKIRQVKNGYNFMTLSMREVLCFLMVRTKKRMISSFKKMTDGKQTLFENHIGRN